MHASADLLTTGGLAFVAVLGVGATGLSVRRWMHDRPWEQAVERLAVAAIVALTAALFGWRAVAVHATWPPLQSHVDGLLLLSCLLAALIVYLQWAVRLRGVDAFALPLLTLMLLWGVCASRWTLYPFALEGKEIWATSHVISVYLGTVGVAAAAVGGAMFLFVQRQLQRRDRPAKRVRLLERMASLEAIEAALMRASAAGFALLTVALVTGVYLLGMGSSQGPVGSWWSPKLALTLAIWAMYAAVIHVKVAPALRGRRAAILSILGFVLLVAVMELSTRVGASEGQADEEGVRRGPSVEAAPIATRGGGDG